MICSYLMQCVPMLGTTYVAAWGSAGPFDAPSGDGQGLSSMGDSDASEILSPSLSKPFLFSLRINTASVTLCPCPALKLSR